MTRGAESNALERSAEDDVVLKPPALILPSGEPAQDEALVVESPGRRAWRRLVRRRGAMVALAVIALIVLAAVFAPWISPYDPTQQSWSLVRKAPSAAHWFGTDEVGRDLLARIIYGGRASLSAGVLSVAIALAVGVPIGLLAGYVGGFVDALISRMTDAMLACPFRILAMALAAFLGPSLPNAMIAIGITATTYISLNFLADLGYILVNPRLRG